MLGDSSVGKTSIVIQFYKGIFSEKSKPTISGNYIIKTIESTDGRKITLNIWDSAGDPRSGSMPPMFIHGSQAAIIVFDIQNENSFKSVEQWIKMVEQSEAFNCRIYIVANKVDLGGTKVLSSARTWASNCKHRLFVSSASDPLSILRIFQDISADLIRKEDPSSKVRFPIPREEEKSCHCC